MQALIVLRTTVRDISLMGYPADPSTTTPPYYLDFVACGGLPHRCATAASLLSGDMALVSVEATIRPRLVLFCTRGAWRVGALGLYPLFRGRRFDVPPKLVLPEPVWTAR